MKFGIVSMQRILNYGSFMQALSLKRMLESLGNDVEFVDYKVDCCIHHKFGVKNRLKRAYRKIGKTATSLLKKSDIKVELTEKEHAFCDFYNLLGIAEEKKYHTKVDVLVIGSDEVFNCLQTNPDVGFSMELFGKNRKSKKLISYAASFGNTTCERLKEFGVINTVSKHLSHFDKISVRDKNSFDVVKSLTGKEPVCHMDPVFVGDIDTLPWKEIDEKNYIIVYGYANRFTDDEKRVIRDFAKKQNLKTVALCEEQDFCDISVRARIDEIIPYFRNARYVITETFHGTIFSAITHRPFVTIVRETIDNSYGNKEKLDDLLIRLGTTDRKITNLSDLEETMLRPIDFERIDLLRETERKKTLEYLKEQMEGI